MANGIVKKEVLDTVTQGKDSFLARLPADVDKERFYLGLCTVLQKTPNLLQCDPKSVLLAAYEAAECGCDLSPARAQGWLIPFGNQATFMPSYRHFIQTAYKTGCVKAFNSEVVYSKDKFKIFFAPVRNIIHEPNMGDRGEPVGAYAVIQFTDGHIDFEYMTKDEIENHRKHSKMPQSLMWKDFWNEGARKTPIRVLAKRLPLTNPGMENLAAAIEKDAQADADPIIPGVLEAEPVQGNGHAEAPATSDFSPEANTVYYEVGRMLTTITGATNRLPLGKMKAVGLRIDKGTKVWSIPGSLTDDFLELCKTENLAAVEKQGAKEFGLTP